MDRFIDIYGKFYISYEWLQFWDEKFITLSQREYILISFKNTIYRRKKTQCHLDKGYNKLDFMKEAIILTGTVYRREII